MIVKLRYQNQQTCAVLVRSDQATGQPLMAGQSLEMMFELEAGVDGVAELILVVEDAVG